MIARYWSGRVHPEDAEAYTDYVQRTGIVAHRETPGNINSMIMLRELDDETEIVVLSLWESLEAVKGFAGDDPERAIFFPEDDRYLTGRDLTVRHYRVPVHAGAMG